MGKKPCEETDTDQKIHLQAKEHQGWPETSRCWRGQVGFFPRDSERTWLYRHFDFNFLFCVCFHFSSFLCYL